MGALLREWRLHRGVSQMHLALEVGVSTRHLSFVETGRAKPSVEMLIALAHGLDVPLRQRNSLLLAAGYAPRYQETSLDDRKMSWIRAALQRLLDAHDPYPGAVLDREWNVVLANAGAAALNRDVPSELLGPPTNVFRLCLHPDGLARHTLNFPQLASFLLGELHHLRIRTRDQGVESLAEEVLRYPNIETLSRPVPVTTENDPELLIPWKLRLNGVSRSYFITLTKFATPQDITLDELTLELFYPVESGEQEGSRYKGPKAT